MLAHWFEWTREVDWGSAPSWVLALTAFLVGWFTISNVRTAREAYVRSKWTEEVATARLVWAVVTKSGVIDKDDPLPSEKADSYFMWDSDVTTAEDDVTRVNQRSIYCIVEVTNNSREPIGNIETRVYDASGRRIVGHLKVHKVLVPGGIRKTYYVSPAPKDYGWSVLYSSIRFRDSAGLIWHRTDTSPPERDENHVRSNAYEQEQVNKWQFAQQRRADFKATRRAKRREAIRASRAGASADTPDPRG